MTSPTKHNSTTCISNRYVMITIFICMCNYPPMRKSESLAAVFHCSVTNKFLEQCRPDQFQCVFQIENNVLCFDCGL